MPFLIGLRVPVKCTFEVSKRNDKACPTVNEPKFENVMLDKRPDAVAEGGRHRNTLVREFRCPERGIAVHFVDNFFQIAKRDLPDRIF